MWLKTYNTSALGHTRKDQRCTMLSRTGARCSTATPVHFHKPPRLTFEQPTLTRPLCATHQGGLFYYCRIWNTYELSALAAKGLLGARSTNIETYDGDRRAVDDQERANEGDVADDSQERHE